MLPIITHKRSLPAWDPFAWIARDFDRALQDRCVDSGGESYGDVGRYPVDIHEDDDHLYVEAEMPGFSKEQVNVTLEDGVLHITAERKAETTEKGKQHLAERRYTRVSRSFTLPIPVDEGAVDAKLANGVLHLTLTKSPEVKPRKITVK